MIQTRRSAHFATSAGGIGGTCVVRSKRSPAARLARFGERVKVLASDGAPTLPFEDALFDRFVSTYVLDLLPKSEISHLLKEAHRVLADDGRLCVAGLSHGPTPVSKAILAIWKAVHKLRPVWVGGCRPIAVVDFLPQRSWEVLYRGITVAWGLASEVVVARKL